MKIYHSFKEVPNQARVVVLGHFDGLHLGHQALIQKGYDMAQKLGIPLMVATFYPQFQSLADPGFKYIMSQETKMKRLEDLAVDEVFSVPFNKTIAELSPEAFARDLLQTTLTARGLVVGFDYTFGYQAKGKAQDLVDLVDPIPVEVIPAYKRDGQVLSSTIIRQLLRQGDVAQVETYLGYPYQLCGEVIHGLANGRKFLVPTANVSLPKDLLLPKPGVYAGRCFLADQPNEVFHSVINIGTKPTVNDDPFETVEAYLMDFDRDIYGERLCVCDLHFLRGISKFASFPELKAAIMKDIEMGRAYLTEKYKPMS